jgi:N-acetylmuramoyl-L-alanine amidase
MRMIHVFIITIIVIVQLFTPTTTSATTPVSSGLEEQFIELVKEGTPAQSIDFTSRTLDPTITTSTFDTIIFNWTIVGNASDVQLRARFLTKNRWSAWRDIVHNPEFAPEDAPRNQYTSTLLDLNALHDAWQIAVVIRPDSQSYLKSIRTITMNNQGANPKRLTLPSAAAKLPRGSKPPIVSRSMWGDATLAYWDANAAPWSGYCNASTNTRTWLPDSSEIAPATHVVVHHTAGSNYADPSTNNWPASVLGIWRYHAMTLGWCDIGYHYLIDPNGVIYEGRYTGVRDNGTVIDGAHALGHNRATIGISLMGNFETVEPSASAVQALENLLSWIGSSKNISLNTDQYYAFKDKTLNTIVGHRDVGSTACPGRFLYAKLPEIRLRASQNVNKPSDSQWIRGVTADRTSVVAGDVVTFRMTIQNIYQSIPISGSAFPFGSADAGFTYDQGQCWAVKDGSGQTRFPRPTNNVSEANNRFRVMAGISGWDSANANTITNCPVASTIDHPWRWSIGSSTLAPGRTRTITGRIRFTQPGTYSVYFGLMKDWVGYPDTACDRTNNQGACQLRPIKITVIKPTPTYAPYVRTQISISTATHAQIQTQVAATQTRAIIDRNNATREVLRGSPSRTPTPRNPVASPLPAVQSVIALRTATQEMQIMRTATAESVQTATAESANQTQTMVVATQLIDDLTATAEPETRTPTHSTTPTHTATHTRTATNSATRTRTNQPTQTRTRTPVPARLFDPVSVTAAALNGRFSQIQADASTLWALKQANPPVLFALDPYTLTQRNSTTIDGINATLMSLNQHNASELFVVGRYAWDLLAVQRFDLRSGIPTRTGVWLYKTMGTPSAIVSTGRYVYLTVNHASSGSTAASAELITLANTTPFTDAFPRRRIPGAITALSNIDSGEFTLLAAGRNLNKTGFVVPIRIGQPINTRLSIAISKPLQSLSAHIQTQDLIPAMLIVGSDGTSWIRLKFTITTRKLEQLHVQTNPSLIPYLISSQPFASIAIASNRLGFDMYYLSRNRYQHRASISISSMSRAIQQYGAYQNQLYWHDGTNIYRAVITLP